MKTILSALLLTCCFALSAHAATDRVRITYASRSISSILAFIATDKGFFKEEALEPQLILTRGTTAIAAAVTGDVEAIHIMGTAIRGIIRGLPLKVLAVNQKLPLFWLVTRPEVKTFNDLRGKTMAVTTIGELGAAASRPIRFEASGPAPVLADAARIERVLENLVGNAFRYSPPDAQVTVQIEANESEAIVTVSDCGIGIPADDLPKVFHRFYRATGSHSASGLGLGLYNSRLIVEHHGGRIWAESAPGAGSAFRFALPIAP